MAPTALDNALSKRDYYCNGFYYSYNCHYSRWDSWGRWVALAVIVVVVLLVAFLFSCYNTRRRRRLGMAPMYGTGWMAGKPAQGQYGNNGGYYNSNQPYNGGTAAPPYSPPLNNQQTGNTFNSNEGYYGSPNQGYAQYGGQQNGIELQQPQNTYNPQRGGDPVYEAPQGAPPGKDHVIR